VVLLSNDIEATGAAAAAGGPPPLISYMNSLVLTDSFTYSFFIFMINWIIVMIFAWSCSANVTHLY
jgi:hypothetical protein